MARWRGPLLLLLALLLPLAPAGHAGEPTSPRLTLDGLPVRLGDGLSRRAGGGFTITRRDLERGLRVDVRRLIPRPTPRRPRRRPAPRTWLFCHEAQSARWAGSAGGAPGAETFPLEAVARALRWKLAARGPGVRLGTGRARPGRRGARPGDRLPALVLPDLDGTPHALRALRGTRVLIVVWAPWSTSRASLSTWAIEWRLRQARNLALWAVAVDLEGAERARPYVPPEIVGAVRLDREGRLASLLGRQAPGRFVLLDDLGLVRAVGDGPDTVDLAWIDLHLAEAGRPARPEERLAPPPPALAALRRAAERRPERAEAHAALSRALERADPAAARAEQQEALRLRPASVAYAMRLARLLLDAGDRPGAIRVLDDARRRSPGTLWLRRQFWALDEPARFYAGPIDTAWQRARQRREDEAWGRLKRR